jgi:hypothetical protein
MPKEILKRGATSNIIRVFLQDSASTTGAGKTALTSTSSGLIISTIADLEATATTYTSAATNVETITTLGTFAAPTASKCRFREVDATNFPGVYELQIADARFAVANSTQLLISIQCTGVAPVFVEYQLVAVDLMDTVRFGLTALPNTAISTNGSLITAGTGTAQLSTTSGVALANTTQWNSVNVTGMPMPTYTQPSGFLAATFPAGTIANTTNITGGTITTVSGNVNGSVNSVATAVTANTTQWGGAAVTGMPMPTYTQPTGFLAASFPTTVASPTNITAGTITTVSGNVNGSVNSVATAVTVGTINAGAINAAAIATGAIDADAIADSAITIRLSGDATPSEGRIVAGSIASDVWNALLTSYVTANTFGARIVRTRSTSPSNEVTITGSFHIAADVHELQAGVITSADFSAGAIDANALATDAATEIATATWTVDPSLFAASTAGYWLYQSGLNSQNIISNTNSMVGSPYIESIGDALLNRNIAGGSNTGRLVKEALYALRNKSEIVGNTLNVYNNVDGAIAWTAAVSSSATADPVTGIDPA